MKNAPIVGRHILVKEWFKYAIKKETLIKRYESTAETYEKKGKREWGYAKNDLGDFHYGKAKDAFSRAKRNREKAEILKKEG